jgi:putative transposase
MIVRKAFKFRLYPTEEQASALRQQGGNARFLYNLLLERHDHHYQVNGKCWKKNAMIVSIPEIKREHPFLQESFSQSLQQVAIQLDRAFVNFFEGRAEHPTFKSKHDYRDSFTCPQKWRFTSKFVFIPKVGEVRWAMHRQVQGKPKHITITQDGDRWFCSVSCEVEIPDVEVKTDDVVGIDLGLKDFAVLSDGTRIENPRHLRKMEKRLRREQRWLSRKQIGSKNRAKQRAKVRAVHRRVRDARRDFLHKTTSWLIQSYDGFVLEDLNVRGMVRNHRLAKTISDVGWGEFGRQLEYKSLWNGKAFVRIGQFFPSSKLCSDCGAINSELRLSDREWVCAECGCVHDRDLNASINIETEGLRMLSCQGSGVAANTLGHSGIYARGEGGSGSGVSHRETTLVESGKVLLASGAKATGFR